MAGWIKMRKGLWEFPKVVAMALRLRVSADAVVGKLFRLWCWADTYATDEQVPHVTAGWVNAHVEQSGFAEAMVAVGWLDTTPTGVRFVNFAQHNWEAGKSKALTANRVEKHRKGGNADVTGGALRERSAERYPPTPVPSKPPLTPLQGGEEGGVGQPKPPEAKPGAKASTEAADAGMGFLEKPIGELVALYHAKVRSTHGVRGGTDAIRWAIQNDGLTLEACRRAILNFAAQQDRVGTPEDKRPKLASFIRDGSWRELSRQELSAPPPRPAKAEAPARPARSPQERAAAVAALEAARRGGSADAVS
jgi:hypothetical protein